MAATPSCASQITCFAPLLNQALTECSVLDKAVLGGKINGVGRLRDAPLYRRTGAANRAEAPIYVSVFPAHRFIV